MKNLDCNLRSPVKEDGRGETVGLFPSVGDISSSP